MIRLANVARGLSARAALLLDGNERGKAVEASRSAHGLDVHVEGGAVVLVAQLAAFAAGAMLGLEGDGLSPVSSAQGVHVPASQGLQSGKDSEVGEIFSVIVGSGCVQVKD